MGEQFVLSGVFVLVFIVIKYCLVSTPSLGGRGVFWYTLCFTMLIEEVIRLSRYVSDIYSSGRFVNSLFL